MLIRAIGERAPVSSANALRSLGMQIAFVLPLSMPLLLPVGLYRLNWFYPAMMILLGAHYLPFVFLYGMRMFAVLAAFLVGGGTLIAMYFSASFSIGAWYTGTILLVFAALGRMAREPSASRTTPAVRRRHPTARRPSLNPIVAPHFGRAAVSRGRLDCLPIAATTS